MRLATMTVLAATLSTTGYATAQGDPPGCLGSIPVMVVWLDPGPHLPGDTILVHIAMVQAAPTGCDYSGGQLSVTMPNGHAMPVAGFPGTPVVPVIGFGPPGPAEFQVEYVLDADDADADGVVVFRADYGPTPRRPDQAAGTVHAQAPISAGSSSAAVPARVAMVPVGSEPRDGVAFENPRGFPPGCSRVASGLLVEALVQGAPVGAVEAGDEIHFRLTVFAPEPTGCSLEGGQLSLTLPDGRALRVAGFDEAASVGFLNPTASVSFIVPVTYVASDADAIDGQLIARASYGPTIDRPEQVAGVFHTDPPLEAASRSAVAGVLLAGP